MGIIDIFSKRQKRLRGEVPDVYSYDTITNPLRVQMIHIIIETIGRPAYDGYSSSRIEGSYGFLHKSLCKEYGVFSLTNELDSTDFSHFLDFILQTKETEKVLDAVEIAFKLILNQFQPENHSINFTPEHIGINAVSELNQRFREHGVGFSFESKEILRIDSTYMHKQVTVPLLNLTHHKKFKGANEEYLKAHEHYRNGRNKECLTDCLKAFESAMKIICKEKNWSFTERDTSRKLIQICFSNQLVPTFSQNQFTSLQNLLESGVPTIRNRLGAHGQGEVVKTVDDEITRYALNLTGANIIFIIEQAKL